MLLSVVCEENGIQKFPKSHNRNHYFYWVKDAFNLGLYTGRREEELINMKFSDIEIDENGTMIIVGEDLKSNRLNQIVDEDDKKRFAVPVGDELKEVLYNLGYEKYKNCYDRFLIAPDCLKRKNLPKRMSKSFHHFWQLTGKDKKLTFYNLRKTHITELQVYTSGKAYEVTGHSKDQVVQDHYINIKRIARSVANNGFRVF